MEISKYEKAQFVAQAKRLLGMAFDTPEGVDMFVHWSGHVQWIDVTINYKATYDEEPDEASKRIRFKAVVPINQDQPVVEILKTIEQCQRVLDELKQEEAA